MSVLKLSIAGDEHWINWVSIPHFLPTSVVTPANTSLSPELLFQSLLKDQEFPALLFLLPGVTTFHNTTCSQPAFGLCKPAGASVISAGIFKELGKSQICKKQIQLFLHIFSQHWTHPGRWEMCTLHLLLPWLVYAVCILGNASGG